MPSDPETCTFNLLLWFCHVTGDPLQDRKVMKDQQVARLTEDCRRRLEIAVGLNMFVCAFHIRLQVAECHTVVSDCPFSRIILVGIMRFDNPPACIYNKYSDRKGFDTVCCTAALWPAKDFTNQIASCLELILCTLEIQFQKEVDMRKLLIHMSPFQA